MPLEHSTPGTPGFSKNIATETRAGKPPAQAAAIAYAMSGEKKDAVMPNLSAVLAKADVLFQRADAAAMDVDCASDAAENPAAHIRHAGLMIDASFKKGSGGTVVDYYVVEGGHGQFKTLEAAKEIAETRAKRR